MSRLEPLPDVGPVWRNREELHRVLAEVRAWYAEGASDLLINFRMRALQARRERERLQRRGPQRGAAR